MATRKQILANRANARKSCGPVSAAGKAKVSQNRKVHGLTGRFEVLEGENQETFNQLLDQYMLDEQPVGIAEIELVKKMVEHLWLAERAGRLQEGCFLVAERTPEQIAHRQARVRVNPALDQFMRYQSHHDRAYQRASTELARRKKERAKAAIGFESQKRAQRQEERRDAKENREVQTHKVRHAIAETKLEHEQIRTALAAAAAVSQIEALSPPKTSKMAA
jgi:hypothetical protein